MITPWGQSQTVKSIAEGIEMVTTAGHGGFRLSAERAKEMLRKYPRFTPFTGSRTWWEEDCDVALVIVAFPECFSAESVARCSEHVAKDSYFAPAR